MGLVHRSSSHTQSKCWNTEALRAVRSTASPWVSDTQKCSGGIFVKLASLGEQGGGTLRMLLRTGFLNNDALTRSIVIVCAYVCKLLQMRVHAQIVQNVSSAGFLKCRPQQTNWMNVTMMIVSHKFQARFVEFSLWNHADHDEMPPSKAYEHVLNPGTS